MLLLGRKFLLFSAALWLSLANVYSQSVDDYLDKAFSQLEQKQVREAMQTLTEGIKALPDEPELYYYRGILFDKVRLPDQSIEDFTKAIENCKTDTTCSDYYASRGGVKFSIRQFEEAYQDLKKALELDENNIAALNNMAVVSDEVGRGDETVGYLERIIALDPEKPFTYVNLGYKYQQMEQHKKAIEYLDKAIELAPTASFAYSNRSFCRLKLGNVKGALKDINKSLELMPTNVYAYKVRALVYLEKGKAEEACADLDTALEMGYTRQYGNEVQELKAKHCQ